MIKSLLLSSLASLGAAAVAYGLWLEMNGERASYKDIADFRISKQRSHRGLYWVFWGVIAEMILGFCVAAYDGWEITQITINEVKNAPRNQLIADISATVRIRVNRQNFSELSHFGGPAEAGLFLAEPPGAGVIIGRQYLRYWYLYPQTQLPSLETDHLIKFPNGANGRTYIMQFHWSEWQRGLTAGAMNDHPVREIDKVNVLNIWMKCLPHNLEILDGVAEVTINDAVVRTFRIPRQKNNQEDDASTDTYSNSTPFVIFAFPTNSSDFSAGNWR